jgi:hypothetical protein
LVPSSSVTTTESGLTPEVVGLSAELAGIFRKPGASWDVLDVAEDVDIFPLASALACDNRVARASALRTVQSAGVRVAKHPSVQPRVVDCLMDSSAEVRSEAAKIRDRWFTERNLVYRWIYEPRQLSRLLAIARWKCGPWQEWDAWQEFAYRAYSSDDGPRHYYYSLPTVIASYDPTRSGSAPFPNYLYSCFARYCAREVATPPRVAPEQLDRIVCPEVDPSVQADISVLFAFARLTARECDVVIQSFVEGLDDLDIAARLDMSAVNVRVHRFRALQKLARARRFIDRLDDLPADCRAVASRHYGASSDRRAPPTDATERALLWRAQDLLLTHVGCDSGGPLKPASEMAALDIDILVLVLAAGRGPREVADWLDVSPLRVRKTLDAYAPKRGG